MTWLESFLTNHAMNNCCHQPATSPTTLASPTPTQPKRSTWPGLNRFIRIASPVAVDFSHMLYTDRPDLGSTPRATLTHYR